MTDVHAYREAIADDCVIGVCSINNCHYPYCRKIEVEHARLLREGWHLDQDGCYRRTKGYDNGTR